MNVVRTWRTSGPTVQHAGTPALRAAAEPVHSNNRRLAKVQKQVTVVED